jgi:Inner membrane component of T3SS, cytoplasmic domain/von Willebrand factor type A domain
MSGIPSTGEAVLSRCAAHCESGAAQDPDHVIRLRAGKESAMFKPMLRAVLSCVGLVWLASAAHAQLGIVSVTQAAPGEVVARVQIDAAAVSSAAPSAGASAAPSAADFSLQLGNGRSVQAARIAAAPADPAATALVVCIDRSGSMGAAALSAVQAALAQSLLPRPGTATLPFQVAVIAFATRSDHLSAFTSDPKSVAGTIANVAIDRGRDGKTRLYDAVAGGLAQLRSTNASVKRLLVISDGNDEDSAITQAALVAQASALPAVPLDAVGFGALASKASGSLSTLAGATRGSFAIAANKDELNAKVAAAIARLVAAETFELGFRYAAAAGGGSVDRPTLRYQPKSGDAVVMPLLTGLAAAADDRGAAGANAASAADAPSHDGGGEGGVLAWLNAWLAGYPMLQRLFASLPPVAAVGLGALLLLGVLLAAWWKLRARGLGPGPVTRPPTVTSAPPAQPSWTQPPTRVPPPPGPAPASARHTRAAYQWPLPAPDRATAVLSGMSGSYSGRRFTISRAATRIGYADDNDLVLAGDEFVSGHHAIIKAEAHSLYLVDLGSRNGSLLNGVAVNHATRALSPGDQLQFGQTLMQVLPADASAWGQGNGREAQVP